MRQTHKGIREDGHPVVILAGLEAVRILKDAGLGGVGSLTDGGAGGVRGTDHQLGVPLRLGSRPCE